MKVRYPGLKYSATFIPGNTPHRDFLRRISEHRYFLWLSAVEGFGLPPLEAMMCGAAIVGFDGGGGDFFRNGENALVCKYPDFRQLADLFAGLLSDDRLAAILSHNGKKTASGHTFAEFRNAWNRELAQWLGRP